MPKITIEQLNTILKTINPDEIKQSIIMQGYRCASELRKMEFSLMDILDGEEQGETDFYEDVFADSGYFAEIFTRVAGYERYVFIVVTKIAIYRHLNNFQFPERVDIYTDAPKNPVYEQEMQKIKTCACCKRDFPYGKMAELNGELFCADCFDKKFLKN